MPATLGPSSRWQKALTTHPGIQRHGIRYGQPVSHPLPGLWPKSTTTPGPIRLDGCRTSVGLRVWRGDYAIIGGDWSPGLNAIDLVGMEELMLQMVDDPPWVDALMATWWTTPISRRASTPRRAR